MASSPQYVPGWETDHQLPVSFRLIRPPDPTVVPLEDGHQDHG
jgi:hypothetical protein